MAAEKITFEDFIHDLSGHDLDFALDLNHYLLEAGCRANFEAKKTGLLGSYKQKKPVRTIINLLLKKQGLFVRIYGENIHQYQDFLETLSPELIETIDGNGDCKRLVSGGCSPKCSGYDFTIAENHFQKCRYNCFEFLVTPTSASMIRSFVEKETNARLNVEIKE